MNCIDTMAKAWMNTSVNDMRVSKVRFEKWKRRVSSPFGRRAT